MRVAVVSTLELHAQGLFGLLSTIVGIEPAICRPRIGRLAETVHQSGASVALLDLGFAANLVAARELRTATPTTRVAALDPSEFRYALAYARAGVRGLLGPDADRHELAECLRDAARGDTHFTPRAAALVCRYVIEAGASAGSTPTLTKRQQEILSMMAADLHNREIADRLCLELSTVKNHVHGILRRLGVHTRAEAALLWQTLDTSLGADEGAALDPSRESDQTRHGVAKCVSPQYQVRQLAIVGAQEVAADS